jgi:hypothetical protein
MPAFEVVQLVVDDLGTSLDFYRRQRQRRRSVR